MSTFGLVVESIDNGQVVYLGLPDARGGYHQVQLTDSAAWDLYRKLEDRLVEIGKMKPVETV